MWSRLYSSEYKQEAEICGLVSFSVYRSSAYDLGKPLPGSTLPKQTRKIPLVTLFRTHGTSNKSVVSKQEGQVQKWAKSGGT